MLSHLPTNHHLRPLYRLLALVSGGYVLAFGIIGLMQTSGAELFDQASTTTVLGLRTNPAFAYASIGVGILVLLSALVGRNLDFYVYSLVGLGFQVVGMFMLAFLRTDANYLNFSVATCVVSLVIGLVLFTAGLYSRVGARAAH
ncbi:hypothetical protein GCM10009682_62400 [Luedemannella flava]|uniref:DUF4383 domain-containing protein n=1 Tax=Luedemannella flava TaxID=349316 RepID=A0ABN2MRK6_9ACTN